MTVLGRIRAMIFLICCQVAAIECVYRESLFARHNNKQLDTTEVYAVHACRSPVECSKICTGQGERCVAANLHCNGRKCICQLISKLPDKFSPDTLMANNTWTCIIKSDIDECSSSPCQNDGTCTDTLYGYTCACADGYTGAHCATNVDECSSSPCQNDGTCSDTVNGYTCVCVDGYTGAHCETNLDECSSSPCQNDGTCSDTVNGYTCACVEGYTGLHCETRSSYATTEPPQPAGPVQYNSSGLAFSVSGDLVQPFGVDVDPDTDILYVADDNKDRVCLFTITGDSITCHTGFVPAQTDDNFYAPRGIALTTDGQLVVTDRHRVMVFTPTVSELTLVLVWGVYNSLGSGLGQFWFPDGVHVSGRHVYVCDPYNYRIQILNMDDANDISVMDAVHSPVPGGLKPRDISIDNNNGLVYVMDEDRIVVYDVTTRQFVREITAADLGQTSIGVLTVATDNIGQVYIGDRENYVIHILAADGVYLQQLGTPGTCPSCVRDPRGIAVHAISGELIVTDVYTRYIKVHQPN